MALWVARAKALTAVKAARGKAAMTTKMKMKMMQTHLSLVKPLSEKKPAKKKAKVKVNPASQVLVVTQQDAIYRCILTRAS